MHPHHPRYGSELAGFNRIVRPRPAVLVAAANAGDVAEAVRFAVALDLSVGVQATGHGGAAVDSRAVVVGTRRMNAVHVDPTTRTARVEAGAQWHQVIAAAARHGLAPLNGSSPLVGVVGYTLGGGLGPLGRQYGYAADHVTRLDIVTADGEQRTVTPEREVELFWAARGGKGSFGIVTGLEFRLMPVARLYGGGLFFPGDQAPEVLHAWRDWTRTVPDTMTSSLALLRPPESSGHPTGGLVVHVRIAFTGSAEEGEALLRPLRAAGVALSDTVGEMPYASVATIHQDPTEPLAYHEQNIVLRELDDSALHALLAEAGPDAGHHGPMVELRHLGGALARSAAVPNAVGNRDGRFILSTLSLPGSAERVLAALTSWGTGRRYVNFLAGPDVARTAVDCYDPRTYERLRRVKDAYDPLNRFDGGIGVRPTGT